jgi:hypothetical protein
VRASLRSHDQRDHGIDFQSHGDYHGTHHGIRELSWADSLGRNMVCDMDRSRASAHALEEAWLKGDVSGSTDCLASVDLLLRRWFIDFDGTNNQPKRNSRRNL